MRHVVVSFGLLLLLGLGYGLAGGWQSQPPPVKPAVPSPSASVEQPAPQPRPPRPGETGQIKMPNGLSYTILRPGTGNVVRKGDAIVAHYTGWRSDGLKFDSSLDRGEPFGPLTIGAGQVIPGWDEGIPGMKVGETRRLYIPSELAYGKRGAGADIPPNSDLVFEVELLEPKN